MSINASAHFDREGDWLARQFFTPNDLRMDPEEYVARHAQDIACFSFDRYRYADPALGSWVRRVGELLASTSEVERCREQYLSPDELIEVRRRAAEEW
jgi:hypothetical protein